MSDEKRKTVTAELLWVNPHRHVEVLDTVSKLREDLTAQANATHEVSKAYCEEITYLRAEVLALKAERDRLLEQLVESQRNGAGVNIELKSARVKELETRNE